jgi:hypothetical protein
VATADWTYELSPGPAGAQGIEGFVVETSDGQRVGTVAAVLGRDDEVYVAVERDLAPADHDLRAVPWADVSAVDEHERAVRLSIDADKIDTALELDPRKEVEGPRADAVRITEVPRLLPAYVDPAETAPPERGDLLAAIGLALAGGVTLLLAAALQGPAGERRTLLLFLIPLVLFASSVALGIRVYRDPSGRRRRPQRTPT